MKTVLNYLAISALTTAAATAVAMGEPATLELAWAQVGLMSGQKGKDPVEVVVKSETENLPVAQWGR